MSIHFLLSILKLLSHIVFFIPLLVLMSMSSDVIASGMVLFLGICHSEMLWVNIYIDISMHSIAYFNN